MTAAPRTKLYLAGPMRGFEYFNFPAFDDAAARLRVAGYTVISPAEMDRADGFDERTLELPDGFVATAMRRDVEALLKVDAIALLPGWERSTGCRIELGVARAIGIDVAEVIEMHADGIADRHISLSPLSAEAEAAAVARAGAAHNAGLGDPPPWERGWRGRTGPLLITDDTEWLPWQEIGDPEVPFETTPLDSAEPTFVDGEVRIVDASGGAKGSKLARFDMIPPDVLHELAEHYGHGERKYPSDPETGEANWQLGYRWSLSAAALMRHLNAWLNGEDDDPELGDSHLIAVVWHAFALRWFQIHGRGTDDLQGRRLDDFDPFRPRLAGV